MERVNVLPVILVILLYNCIVLYSADKKPFRSTIIIDLGWKFYLGDDSSARNIEYNDAKWRTIDLPHDWSVKGTYSPNLASATGYLPGGIAWYRKELDSAGLPKDKKVYIYFEGIYRNAEVFFNGVSLGTRPNGYISYWYDLTPHIRHTRNVLAVRVDHSKYIDSRWYTGSGIYRNVYLVITNPVHIDVWGVYFTSKVGVNNNAIATVQVAVRNTTAKGTTVKVVNELFDKAGKSIAKSNENASLTGDTVQLIVQKIELKNSVLWSIDNPYLYKLVTTVYADKGNVDQVTTNVGIRDLRFDANKGFFLNGQNIKVKGVCMHHDAGFLGAAVPEEVWRNRIASLKSLGCNAIRTSHNPQAPVLYNLCDEMGMLVLNEAFDEWELPKKKWIEGWNVGKPGYDGHYEFFKEWGETDLRGMVLRDRNHPSVFMWSIGNEVDYPNDPYSHPILNKEGIQQEHKSGYLPDHPHAERLGVIAKNLAEVVRKYDPSRPVTAGLAGPVMSNETDYPTALDVVGYNYTERRYEKDHAAYPNRVLYGSENGHSFDAWKAVRDNEFIFGQFLWTGYDYLGEAGPWPSRGFATGLFDLAGFKKPRGYFRESLWSDKPMVYIGTYPKNSKEKNITMNAPPNWNYNESDTVRIVCYTNCENAELKLNGHKVGELHEHNDITGIIQWDIPFSPGKLEVTGYNLKSVVASYAIETSDRPYAIKVKTSVNKIKPDRVTMMIALQIVDQHNIPVFLSDEDIICRTEGPVKLLGMETGNMSDMGNYSDVKQRAYQGRMVIYIQSTGVQGKATVTLTSPWLEKAVIDIEISE